MKPRAICGSVLVRSNAYEYPVLAQSIVAWGVAQSAIDNKTSKPTSQRASLAQHHRRETAMLNLIKTHNEGEPDFLSFVAHPFANMFPMIEGSAFEELKR